MTAPAPTRTTAPRTAPNGTRRPTNREAQADRNRIARQRAADHDRRLNEITRLLATARPTAPRTAPNGARRGKRRNPEWGEHGTRYRYVNGCRCAPCTQANTEYQRHRGGHQPRKPAPAPDTRNEITNPPATGGRREDQR